MIILKTLRSVITFKMHPNKSSIKVFSKDSTLGWTTTKYCLSCNYTKDSSCMAYATESLRYKINTEIILHNDLYEFNLISSPCSTISRKGNCVT